MTEWACAHWQTHQDVLECVAAAINGYLKTALRQSRIRVQRELHRYTHRTESETDDNG
jgi:hypothetical protein